MTFDLLKCTAGSGVVPCTCNPGTWKVETERSEIQIHPQLYSEFKVSLGYMNSRLKQNIKL